VEVRFFIAVEDAKDDLGDDPPPERAELPSGLVENAACLREARGVAQ
jgi:hypothetical protein